MNNEQIPAAAVEAAAKATYEHANMGAAWSDAAPEWHDAYKASVLAGLEAAAPHIAAAAWDAAVDAAYERRVIGDMTAEDLKESNPYVQ